jgi:hypothetical protein
MAAATAAKAKRSWPDVIGDVLADTVMALLDLPLWLRSQTRTQELIDAILSLPEERDRTAAVTDRCTSSSAGVARQQS